MTEAERWTRELLAELHEACFSLRGWSRFFRDSAARAREQWDARPRARREAIAVGAVGLTAWGVVAFAGHPIVAAAGAAWWLLVVSMLGLHLGMLETPEGRVLDRMGVPNLMTLGRAAIVPALPVFPPKLLAGVLVAAAASDVLDGALARVRAEVTRLGLWLDGTVDGIVLGVGAATLAHDGLLPWWSAALVLFRVALPWLSAPAWFARATVPRMGEYVSGRIPGALVLAGLFAAALSLPGAAVAVAAGAVGGMGTFAATLRRASRTDGWESEATRRCPG